MASEIETAGPGTGKTLYFIVRGGSNNTGLIWNTGTSLFEAYNNANYANYAIAMVEQGANNVYVGNFPSAIIPGMFNIVAYQQITGSPLQSDPRVGAGEFQWNGTNPLPLSDLTTSGQLGTFGPIKIYRGQMVTPWPFKLVSSTDHVTPFTSGVCSGQIARDNGAFGPLQSGAFTEIGLGWYNCQALTSGDLLANSVKLVFTANGISGGSSDQRDFGLILQRTSGF
jgi:hypothetical protein